MCLRERDSLSDKLKMMDTGHLDRVAQSNLDTGSRRGDTGDLTVEQAYEDLKAEYKVNAKQIGIHYNTSEL